MLGMDFVSIFILFIINVVVSAILHYGFKYYATPGTASCFSKIVVGWLVGLSDIGSLVRGRELWRPLHSAGNHWLRGHAGLLCRHCPHDHRR